MIAPDDPNYSRVEGTTFANACQTDAECFTGGCSSEVCSAQQGVSSTCIAPADGWPNAGGSCGCVSGQCVWYTTAGTTPAPGTTGTTTDPGTTGTTDPGTTTTDPGTTNPDPATSTGGQTQPCTAAGTCNTGLSCLTYYGIAGASGPKFTSCEIPCGQGKPACPAGQMCATIADGPGTVCRPKK